MAALAVFALLYVVIFRAATGGIFLEGEARRRLEASLLADREIIAIEAEGLTGTPPAPGSREREEGLFRVAVAITPVEAASLGIELAASESAEGNDLRTRRSRGPGSTSLFDAAAGDTTPLVQVVVRVGWIEPRGAREVVRTAYAYSAEAAAPLLADLAPATGFDPDANGEGRDDPPEEPDA